MQLRYGVFCLKSQAIVLLIYGCWTLLYDYINITVMMSFMT